MHSIQDPCRAQPAVASFDTVEMFIFLDVTVGDISQVLGLQVCTPQLFCDAWDQTEGLQHA